MINTFKLIGTVDVSNAFNVVDSRVIRFLDELRDYYREYYPMFTMITAFIYFKINGGPWIMKSVVIDLEDRSLAISERGVNVGDENDIHADSIVTFRITPLGHYKFREADLAIMDVMSKEDEME